MGRGEREGAERHNSLRGLPRAIGKCAPPKLNESAGEGEGQGMRSGVGEKRRERDVERGAGGRGTT
jgi:hypothetical protein